MNYKVLNALLALARLSLPSLSVASWSVSPGTACSGRKLQPRSEDLSPHACSNKTPNGCALDTETSSNEPIWNVLLSDCSLYTNSNVHHAVFLLRSLPQTLN